MPSLVPLVVCTLIHTVTPRLLLPPNWDQQFDSRPGHPNSVHQNLFMQCPSGQVLFRFTSIYDELVNDRSWTFYCRESLGTIEDCWWTAFVNDWHQPVMFKCPYNGVITGVRSLHNDVKRDRRWSYRCCSLKTAKYADCSISEYLNAWGGVVIGAKYFGYDTPIVGMFSVYNTTRLRLSQGMTHGGCWTSLSRDFQVVERDRRWKVEMCFVRDCV